MKNMGHNKKTVTNERDNSLAATGPVNIRPINREAYITKKSF